MVYTCRLNSIVVIMKKAIWLGMAAVVLATLAACSSDESVLFSLPVAPADSVGIDTTQQDTTVVVDTLANTAETVVMLSWNVESGGATTSGIIGAMERVEDAVGQVDIWALQEVEASWPATFSNHLGNQYAYVLGTTGRTDRLCVMYNSNKFEVVQSQEFHDMNPGGRVRAPLMVRMKQKSDGDEFLVVVNHLYRSSSSGRQEQAQKLNTWVQTVTEPTVLTGDFNFDYDIATGIGNQSYNLFVAGGHVQWVVPQSLVKTQCSPRYNSILDFFFVNNTASQWQATSQVLVWTGDCGSPDTQPDHRPVLATFTF